MNINQLFEQFVGVGNEPAAQNNAQQSQQPADAGVSGLLGNFPGGAAGGLAGGLAAGGLLGALIGNKKMRKKAKKMAGGALGYGGSAVLGALALKAYQNWQSGKSEPSPAAGHGQPGGPAPTPESFDPALNEDSTGQPMQLALVKAMIAAANADGHIDRDEQAAVFDAVDRMSLDAESKAIVFDVLRNPPNVTQIAGYATGLEQATEIYMASRLAVDPDQPSEQQYLRDLARAMALPDGLVQEIEAQFDAEPAPRP